MSLGTIKATGVFTKDKNVLGGEVELKDGTVQSI